jgi:DNA polymerase-1
MKLIWDIEANGLLSKQGKKPAADTIWMVVTKDIETDKEYIFCDHTTKDGSRPLKEAWKHLSQAKELIGHNIISYDLPVLKKLVGWVPNPKTVIRDTMLMSQILDYNRFGGRHALSLWGQYLGQKKPEHEDWMNYSDDMLHRCREDVGINEKVYRLLARELSTILSGLSDEKQGMFKRSLRIEHEIATFSSMCHEGGWVFDINSARKLQFAMQCEMADIEKEIVPKLKIRVKCLERRDPANNSFRFKEPEFRKDGAYMARTCAHFKIEQSNGKTSKRLIDGPYNKVEFVEPDMSSMDAIKLHLDAIGWEPLDWNWEKKGREFTKKSPKLCTESLLKLGRDGELIDRYTTTKSRLGILNGWINNLSSDGRLRGDMFTIATPTGRARHKTVVNVPGADAAWGKEMRSLFGCEKGYKVVGADSAGNQFRALCHYIKDDDFTNEVINGDVHQKNADILGCKRSTAKPWIYAFLFGAGLEKLGLILTGVRNAKAGKESRAKFAAAIPGFKRLVDRLNEIYQISEHQNKRPSIPALDGRRIYIDSSHKALNYLLQSAEGITCKAAVSYTMAKFKEENIDARPLVFYHDEQEWAVREDQAQRAAEIMAESFREAPKWFGVECMDGDALIGDNWYDVH